LIPTTALGYIGDSHTFAQPHTDMVVVLYPLLV